MRLAAGLLSHFTALFRNPECRVCGFRHGPLMTLDMNGRLTTAGTPRAVILLHYARQIAAARKLGRQLRGQS